MVDWGSYDTLSIDDPMKLKEADFAIILYLDDLPEVKKISDTRKERTISKSDAIALIKDMLQSNKNRYFNYSMDKIIKDQSNLQKLVLRIMCDDYGIFTAYRSSPTFEYLKAFIEPFRYNDYRRLQSLYTTLDRDYAVLKERYKTGVNYILQTTTNKDLKDIIEIFLDVSALLKDRIGSSEIGYARKFKDLYRMFISINDEVHFSKSGELRFIMNNTNSTNFNLYNDFDFSKDLNLVSTLKPRIEDLLKKYEF